jgi:hypothetical protein
VEQVIELEETEEQLRTELDEADLAEAATRALVPLEESKARLMLLRSQATAENSLYRAYDSLKKARKGREAAGEDREPVAPVVTVADVVEPPVAAIGELPNKANLESGAPVYLLPNKANCDAEGPAGPLPNKAKPAGTGATDGPALPASSTPEGDFEGGRLGIHGPCGPWAAAVPVGPMIMVPT